MLKRLIFVFLLALCAAGFAKPPSINSRDTCHKIDEILKAHVSYQKLTTEIVQRAFLNFLDELDPAKTYFLEKEVEVWTHASPALLSSTLEGMKREEFKAFQDLHEKMFDAIARRTKLERDIEKTPL